MQNTENSRTKFEDARYAYHIEVRGQSNASILSAEELFARAPNGEYILVQGTWMNWQRHGHL